MCDQQSLRPACAYAQSDQSLYKSLEYSMRVKLLSEHHLEFLSLKGGCRGSSESTLVKMPHCWKSHAMAHMFAKLELWLPSHIYTDPDLYWYPGWHAHVYHPSVFVQSLCSQACVFVVHSSISAVENTYYKGKSPF